MRRHLWLHLAVLAVVLGCGYALSLSNDKVAFDQELNTIDSHDDEQSLKDILKKNPKLALADDYRFNKMLKSRPTNAPVVPSTAAPTTEAGKVEIKPRATSFDVDASHSELTKSTTTTEAAAAAEEEYDDDDDDDDYYYEEDSDADDTKDSDKEEAKSKPLKPLKGEDSLPPPDEDLTVIVSSSTSKAPPTTTSTVTPTPTPAKKKVTKTTTSTAAPVTEDDQDDDEYDESDDAEYDEEDQDIDEPSDDAEENDEDDEEELKSDSIPCPRDCVCHMTQGDTMIATCSRLDLEVQKFSSAITDLEVVNIEPKYPIILGENFFSRIGLRRVVTIKIVNCTIESIAPTAFKGLTDLFAVNLTNTGLDMLHPDTFANNSRLKILTLAGNNLSAMQETPSPFSKYMMNVPSLEELNLSNCNLSRLLPTAFDKLKRIVYINLSDNDIETLPETLFNNANTIEELDLSFNAIKTLPKEIFTQTSLAMLHLKYNKISNSLDFLTGDLQKLDLSYNKIAAISGGMFKHLTGLQSLELKGNDITRIHQAAFLSLKNLRNVDLSFTKLDQVPSMLFLKNQELDVIKLNDNPNLKALPMDGFVSESGVFSVYHLDVSMCDISSLADNTFKSMPYLSRLNLGWNNLVYVNDKVFAPLKKLKDLDLTNNILENMHDNVFAQNSEMTKISLAGNNFNEFNPATFEHLPKLVDLDLSDCDFSRLWTKKIAPKTFPSLKYLNVSNNVLKKLSPSDFNHMPKLAVLDVSENPLVCNKDFKDLMTYVVKQSIGHGPAEKTHAALAAMRPVNDKFMNPKTVQKSWQSLAYTVCTSDNKDSMATDEHVNALPLDDAAEDSDLDDDYDSYIDEEIAKEDQDKEEDDDQDADDAEVDAEIIDGGLTVTAVEKKKGNRNMIIDKNSFEEIFEELEQDAKEVNEADFRRTWWTIAIFTTSCLVLVLVIVKVASIMLNKRHERYRQAILASKNSFVYQKLSEEKIGKTPAIPKVHRYQPIEQV